MKVGSLVECVFDFSSQRWEWGKEDAIVPVVGNIYTVHSFHPKSDEHIVLEECYSICPVNGRPHGYPKGGFREIQPPMDISALIQECQTQLITL